MQSIAGIFFVDVLLLLEEFRIFVGEQTKK